MAPSLFNIPGSVPLGSILGIPIRLHVLFFVLLGAQLLGSIYYGGRMVLLWFILLGPILLATVLIHELGHCLAARSVGSSVHGILLWPLGGLAFIGQSNGPKADMWVAVAGPLTHVPMVGFWVAMLAVATHNATGSWHMSLSIPWPEGPYLGMAVCAGALIMNISLFAFNLLVPAYPLDGGRILVNALLWGGVSEVTTARITVGLAVPIGLALVVWGCVQFQMVTILVGAFILHSSWQLYSAVRTDTLKQHPMFAHTEGSSSGAGAGSSNEPAQNYFKFPGQGSQV